MSYQITHIPAGPLQTNCYVLTCTTTGQAAIIDPAWDGDAIAGYIAEQGWTVSHILLTHSHFDHVGGLAALQAATDAPVYAHEESVPMLRVASESARRWQIEMEQPQDPDTLLELGQQVEVGTLTLDVLYTPGHAPGHVCYYLADKGILFDGDVLFQRSIGRTDLPGGDYALLMRSIQTELLTLPDETVVLSGHGSATTIGDERRHNPFLTDLT